MTEQEKNLIHYVFIQQMAYYLILHSRELPLQAIFINLIRTKYKGSVLSFPSEVRVLLNLKILLTYPP